MEILDYATAGGKNLILEYIDNLPSTERMQLYELRSEIRETGLEAVEKLNTRQLKGKLWEIKVSQNRIMYVILDCDRVVFLHICKKQKGKAEKQELNKAINRGRREGII